MGGGVRGFQIVLEKGAIRARRGLAPGRNTDGSAMDWNEMFFSSLISRTLGRIVPLKLDHVRACVSLSFFLKKVFDSC